MNAGGMRASKTKREVRTASKITASAGCQSSASASITLSLHDGAMPTIIPVGGLARGPHHISSPLTGGTHMTRLRCLGFCACLVLSLTAIACGSSNSGPRAWDQSRIANTGFDWWLNGQKGADYFSFDVTNTRGRKRLHHVHGCHRLQQCRPGQVQVGRGAALNGADKRRSLGLDVRPERRQELPQPRGRDRRHRGRESDRRRSCGLLHPQLLRPQASPGRTTSTAPTSWNCRSGKWRVWRMPRRSTAISSRAVRCTATRPSPLCRQPVPLTRAACQKLCQGCSAIPGSGVASRSDLNQRVVLAA